MGMDGVLPTVVLEHACSYFTLWELYGRREKTVNEVWDRIQPAVRPDMPLYLLVDSLPDLVGMDKGRLRAIYESVHRDLLSLEPTDRVLSLGDPQYPNRLAQVPGAPRFLFMRGNVSLLNLPSLSVVGTRNPTEGGRLRARKLGYLLAKRGIVVVSGLAQGIDESAHRGALDIGGATIAVIGTPLDQVYPREHLALQKLIGTVGLVVSQFYPGAGIRRHHFPMRNATMSGLSLGTVVVEASETSGALIQARQCLKQGRKLFIPQSAIDNPALSWPKRFLERGAHRFGTIEELVEVLESENLVPKEHDGGDSERDQLTTSSTSIQPICLLK